MDLAQRTLRDAAARGQPLLYAEFDPAIAHGRDGDTFCEIEQIHHVAPTEAAGQGT
jgi:hypothetical protein